MTNLDYIWNGVTFTRCLQISISEWFACASQYVFSAASNLVIFCTFLFDLMYVILLYFLTVLYGSSLA